MRLALINQQVRQWTRKQFGLFSRSMIYYIPDIRYEGQSDKYRSW